MPIVEINCSRDCERVKDKGREPARKDAMAMTVLRVSSIKSPSSILTETPCSHLGRFVVFLHGIVDQVLHGLY